MENDDGFLNQVFENAFHTTSWKVIVAFFILLSTTFNGTSQIKSDYARGFEIGFKEGYCYNNNAVDCFTPMTPLSPLPRLNESRDNYTQGYNRGFQFGLDLKRSNDAINGNSPSRSQVPKFNDYTPQQPVNEMAAVGIELQRRYDERVQWTQSRINQLYEILNSVFSEATLPSDVRVNETRSLYWKPAADYANSIRSVDFADNFQFSSVQSNFNKIEKSFYDGYNEIIRTHQSASEQTTPKESPRLNVGVLRFEDLVVGDWSSSLPILLSGKTMLGFEIFEPSGVRADGWNSEGVMYDHLENRARALPSSFDYRFDDGFFKIRIKFSAAGLEKGQEYWFKTTVLDDHRVELSFGKQKAIYFK